MTQQEATKEDAELQAIISPDPKTSRGKATVLLDTSMVSKLKEIKKQKDEEEAKKRVGKLDSW
jgi:hypothetical protein